MKLEKAIQAFQKELTKGLQEFIVDLKLEDTTVDEQDPHIIDWNGLENQLKELEVSDLCQFGIGEMSKKSDSEINLKPEDSEVIIRLLKVLGGYGIKDALQLLDSAKSVLLECTLVHEKYKF